MPLIHISELYQKCVRVLVAQIYGLVSKLATAGRLFNSQYSKHILAMSEKWESGACVNSGPDQRTSRQSNQKFAYP